MDKVKKGGNKERKECLKLYIVLFVKNLTFIYIIYLTLFYFRTNVLKALKKSSLGKNQLTRTRDVKRQRLISNRTF